MTIPYLPLLQQKKNIQSKKRKKEKINEKEAFISFATFHIIYGMKFILEQENLDEELLLRGYPSRMRGIKGLPLNAL